MKSLIIIFGTLLLLIAFPSVFLAIDNAITQDTEQSFAGVTTGAGEYAANVTLSRELYGEDEVNVSAVSSNISGDSPTAYSYNSVSKALEITGLAESQDRTLMVDFVVDSTTIPTGTASFIALFRWFYVFLVIGMTGGAVYAFFD